MLAASGEAPGPLAALAPERLRGLGAALSALYRAAPWEALADVQPGGHFFATPHTMERFDRAFYAPLVADLSNFGTWEAAGAKTATERATAIWQQVLADYRPPEGAGDRGERIAQFIADRTAAGGAAPPD